MNNISDQKIQTLLYPGSTTKVFCTYQPWFGEKTKTGWKHHDDTKLEFQYSCQDPAHIESTLDRWQQLGIEGFAANWYGDYATFVDNATYLMFQAAAKRGIWGTLQFDKGVFTYKRHSWSNLKEMQYQLDFLKGKYFSLPNFHKYKDGRLLMLEFCQSQLLGQWPSVLAYNKSIAWLVDGLDPDKNSLAGNYVWDPTVPPLTSYGAVSFYTQQKNHPDKIWVGMLCKGFNDYDPANPSKSVWGGPVRINDERNGQNWLDSFTAINSNYTSGNQLEYAQVVTWNDHEEGTGIEFGIKHDCMVTLTPKSGKIFIAMQASNYKPVSRVDIVINPPNGNPITLSAVNVANPVDLTSYTDAGDYSVQAIVVGKAGFRNNISASVTATLIPPTAGVWTP